MSTPVAWRWERLETATSPGAVSRHAMAHDPERGLTVLFGGLRGGSPGRTYPSDETWVFDGRDWRRVDVDRRPVPRHRAAMVWDARLRRCLLFGGQTKTEGGWPMLDDAWTFDGARWRRAEGWLRFTRPRARCAHHLAYDEDAGRVVLFGGSVGTFTVADTWTFERGAWTRHDVEGPSAREWGAMAWDPSRRACVLYGGSPDDEGGQRLFSDTWCFDGRAWRRLELAADAGPRDDFVLTWFRAPTSALVLSGSSCPSSHTAVLEPTGWRALPTDVEPSKRQCAAMVYHDGLGAGLFHGGERFMDGPRFADTWVLRAGEHRLT